MSDYTRGDDSVYDGFREGWAREEEEKQEAYRQYCEETYYRGELAANLPLDRLREIVEAEADGRCVVLPCKMGSNFYDVHRYYKRSKVVKCEPVKMTVDHFTIGDAGIPIATACSEANEWGDYEPENMMTPDAARAEVEAALEGKEGAEL